MLHYVQLLQAERYTVSLNGAQAIVAGAIVNSSSCLAYGLESFVDVIASALVLWRFWEEADDPKGLAANIGREERTNVGIAATVRKAIPVQGNSEDASLILMQLCISCKFSVHYECLHSEGLRKGSFRPADIGNIEHAGSDMYSTWL